MDTKIDPSKMVKVWLANLGVTIAPPTPPKGPSQEVAQNGFWKLFGNKLIRKMDTIFDPSKMVKFRPATLGVRIAPPTPPKRAQVAQNGFWELFGNKLVRKMATIFDPARPHKNRSRRAS